MARDDPPKHPKEGTERREQANRIAAIGHRISEIGLQISAAIRVLGDQITTIAKQIQTDKKTNETHAKEGQDRTFRWIKIGTISSIFLSICSVGTSIFALIILYNQLYSMRIEQRAWIQIEHVKIPIAENTPLVAEIIVRNTGRTAASRVEGNFTVRKVMRDDPADLQSTGGVNSFSGILSPDATFPTHVPLGEKPDMSNLPFLTKTDVTQYESGETYIVAFGRVAYVDVYGISHWINYCSWQVHKPGKYAFRNCVEYNNVDNN